MGCHTWCYRKIEISNEKLKSDALKICDYQIQSCEDWITHPEKIYWTDNKESFIKQLIKEQKFFTRAQRLINKDILKKDGLVGMYIHTTTKFIEIENHLDHLYFYSSERDAIYIEDTGFHNIFRLENYPSNKLYSLQETLDFISKHGEKVYYSNQDYIHEFWDKFPNGLIMFE